MALAAHVGAMAIDARASQLLANIKELAQEKLYHGLTAELELYVESAADRPDTPCLLQFYDDVVAPLQSKLAPLRFARLLDLAVRGYLAQQTPGGVRAHVLWPTGTASSAAPQLPPQAAQDASMWILKQGKEAFMEREVQAYVYLCATEADVRIAWGEPFGRELLFSCEKWLALQGAHFVRGVPLEKIDKPKADTSDGEKKDGGDEKMDEAEAGATPSVPSRRPAVLATIHPFAELAIRRAGLKYCACKKDADAVHKAQLAYLALVRDLPAHQLAKRAPTNDKSTEEALARQLELDFEPVNFALTLASSGMAGASVFEFGALARRTCMKVALEHPECGRWLGVLLEGLHQGDHARVSREVFDSPASCAQLDALLKAGGSSLDRVREKVALMTLLELAFRATTLGGGRTIRLADIQAATGLSKAEEVEFMLVTAINYGLLRGVIDEAEDGVVEFSWVKPREVDSCRAKALVQSLQHWSQRVVDAEEHFGDLIPELKSSV